MMNRNAAGLGSSSEMPHFQVNMMERQLDMEIGGNALEGGQRGNVPNNNRLQIMTGANSFEGGQMEAIIRDGDLESQIENENQEGANMSDGQSSNPKSKTKGKKYHRHTQIQIDEMEKFFKDCPHPSENQRKQIGVDLGMDPLQVKFWFQNRRTQAKTMNERHENNNLRQLNEKLRMENIRFRDALNNASCTRCGGPAIIPEVVTFEEQSLRLQNNHLRSEMDRITTLATQYFGKPMPSDNNVSSPVNPQTLDLSFGQSATGGDQSMLGVFDHFRSVTLPTEVEKQVIMELAVSGMEEIMLLTRIDEPLWTQSHDGTFSLNEDEYMKTFPSRIGSKSTGFKFEASRECAVVMMNHAKLVDVLMDANQWSNMFSSIVLRATSLDVLSTGVTGNYNGAVQVMIAEFQAPSPLVPTQECYFLRFSKQHFEGIWSIVDVALDQLRPNAQVKYRRRPSGCLIQELPNGFSKVTWVEHVEVDNSTIHNIYKPVVNAGLAFGAKRWVGVLYRESERLVSAMSMDIPATDFNHLAILHQEGRKSMLKLGERMVKSFYQGLSVSSVQRWTAVPGGMSNDVKIMSQTNVNDPGRPLGVAISAATSFWLPIPPRRVFDLLRDENLRNMWDVLSNGGIFQEVTHIASGRQPGDCTSLLIGNSATIGENNMLLLQESYYDPIASYLVYAPVDIVAMNIILSAGGNSDSVALLPSGFAIMPDGPLVSGEGLDGFGCGGSLLTVAFQILIDSIPTYKVPLQNVDTINGLMTCTVDRIKAMMARHNG